VAGVREEIGSMKAIPAVTAALLAAFPASDYPLLHAVDVAVPDGTTQIDHILVSRYGVFVIETKHGRGWIPDRNWRCNLREVEEEDQRKTCLRPGTERHTHES
jgi:hypothetical protein